MKSFIFVFSGGVPEREKLVKVLNQMPAIVTWRYDTEACFYLLSESTAIAIAKEIKRLYPGIGRHVVTQLGNEYWGELTAASWHLLEKKQVPSQPS